MVVKIKKKLVERGGKNLWGSGKPRRLLKIVVKLVLVWL
jgi:hypothetical protein